MNTSPERVYVVDDDQSVRTAVCRLLESVGLTCETFGLPELAMASIGPESAGCLVMDVRMPVISGVQAYLAMKEAGVTLPVVFVTAHQDVPTTVRAMQAGAIDVLLKPFNSQALIDAVQMALAEDRRRRTASLHVAHVRERFAQLTPKERDVMYLVVAGKANKEIGVELGASEKTIKVHRAQVMRKMAATSVPDLVRIVASLTAETGSDPGMAVPAFRAQPVRLRGSEP